MKKSILFTCVLILFSFVTSYAQSKKAKPKGKNAVNHKSSMLDGGIAGYDSRLYTYDLSKKVEYNNVFLNEEWIPTYLISQKGQLPDKYRAKYDIFNQELYILSNGDELVIPKNVFKSFILNEGEEQRKFVIIYSYLWKTTLPYLEVLVDGKLQLLVCHKAKKKRVNNNPIANSGSIKGDRIKKSKDYYLYDGEMLIQIPKKNKRAIEAMSSYDIENYVKTHKIKFKKEEDLVKLVNHLNSL